MNTKHEGWWRQLHWKRYHYIRDRRTLCGKRNLPGDPGSLQPPDNERCKECQRKLESMKGTP